MVGAATGQPELSVAGLATGCETSVDFKVVQLVVGAFARPTKLEGWNFITAGAAYTGADTTLRILGHFGFGF